MEAQVIKFKTTAGYFRLVDHCVESSHIRSIAKRKFGLTDEGWKLTKHFFVRKEPGCKQWMCRAEYHSVDQEEVRDWALTALRMVPVSTTVEKVVEKVVEKIIEVPLQLSFEEREILAFAMQREKNLTNEAIKAYTDEEALELAGRMGTIRSLINLLGLPEVSGEPAWLMRRVEPQLTLFKEI